MKKYLVSILLFSCSLFGMEKDSEKLTVYAVPGCRGDRFRQFTSYLRRTLDSDKTDIIFVESFPLLLKDLGQFWSERKLSSDVSKEGIIYGVCNGGATALNFFADHQGDDRIKGVFLEGTFASANLAIKDVSESFLVGLPKLPLSSYWMPYIVKLWHPFYRPIGRQPIKSASRILTERPIVIMHAMRDCVLPDEHAKALYYALKKNGNKNVYFVHDDSSRHLYLRPSKDRVISAILQRHGLLRGADLQRHGLLRGAAKSKEVDLTSFQPPFEQFEDAFKHIRRVERVHKFLYPAVLYGSFFVLRKLFKNFVN